VTFQHKNYYQIFDLPISFEVDTALLANRYRELQRVVHPDKFANAGAQERRLAVQQATLLNDAFGVLKDPLQRARYLLQLREVDLAAVDAGQLEPAFLMEQMELRERLGGIREAADPAAGLAALGEQLASGRQTLVAALTSCFSNADPASLQQAGELVKKLQFMYRLQDELDRLEEELI